MSEKDPTLGPVTSQGFPGIPEEATGLPGDLAETPPEIPQELLGTLQGSHKTDSPRRRGFLSGPPGLLGSPRDSVGTPQGPPGNALAISRGPLGAPQGHLGTL